MNTPKQEAFKENLPANNYKSGNGLKDELKSDIDSLKNNLVGIANKAIETGTESVVEARKKAGVQVEKLRAAGLNGLKMTEERIRDKPAQSIAIAFLAGFLINALLGRSNSSK